MTSEYKIYTQTNAGQKLKKRKKHAIYDYAKRA